MKGLEQGWRRYQLALNKKANIFPLIEQFSDKSGQEIACKM